MLLSCIVTTACSEQVETGPAIFFTPHQDDETLFMGADISLQYRLGRQVIIVLVTKGEASDVRYKMCMQKNVCLTKAQFVAARNDEMAAAVKRLAPNAVIRYENYHDGELTQVQAFDVFDKYIKLYPHASFKTMSWKDDNPDHRALAYALKDICINKHRIPNDQCYFFQNRKYWDSMPVKGHFVAGHPSEIAAANEMSLWKPSIDRYAIGHLSAYEYFTALRKDPRNKYHYVDAK
jgi:LmbE family N-acetylglucosaminyl deacetylase